jgi:predicted O-methyltransferase YrrM
VLRLLAIATAARAVVEVGTGAGVSGLWLLAGMRPEGVLTTVDIESENQRAAREAFGEAGIAPGRYRTINGSAAEVLPRLRDGAYDLVFVDADKTGYPVYYQQALRLLRPGGVVAFDNMLWHDRVADISARDTETAALRELGKTVRDDDRMVAALLPVGDGLLAGAKR